MTPIKHDAELVALGHELKRLWDIERPLWDASGAATGEAAERFYKLGQKAQANTLAVIERINALPASTVAGLLAKSLAVEWTIQCEEEEHPEAASLVQAIKSVCGRQR